MSPDVQTPTSTRLAELARVIRSKNAGSYELTFDVMFDQGETYALVRDSGVLTREAVARLFDVPDSDILYCDFFEPALAFKATLVRHGDQGGIGERDTFGAQQHAPLLDVAVPRPADGVS